jgi:hypothetical protein
MRDPCLIQGPDGIFRMVWTTGWHDKGIGLAYSRDLVEWSPQKYLPVMEHEPNACNCWAPEIIWDPDSHQYLVFWATTVADRFQETARPEGGNHRIYFTTTRDFVEFAPTRLFYDPGFSVIDATIVPGPAGYVMILKDETEQPPRKDLRLAYSSRIAGPWSSASPPFTIP